MITRSQTIPDSQPASGANRLRGAFSLRRFDAQLTRAWICYWLWQIATKLVLGVIYFEVISEGLRIVVPVLGKKMHRIAGLGFFNDYEATFRLDLAHFLSIFLMIAVFVLWRQILEIWLGAHQDAASPSWYADRHQVLVVALGSLILLSDALLFYFAIGELGWSGGRFSFTSLVATCAYLGVVVFASYISIVLRQRVHDLQLRR